MQSNLSARLAASEDQPPPGDLPARPPARLPAETPLEQIRNGLQMLSATTWVNVPRELRDAILDACGRIRRGVERIDAVPVELTTSPERMAIRSAASVLRALQDQRPIGYSLEAVGMLAEMLETIAEREAAHATQRTLAADTGPDRLSLLADRAQAEIEIRGVIRDLIEVEEWIQKLRGTPAAAARSVVEDELPNIFRRLGRIRATANDALDAVQGRGESNAHPAQPAPSLPGLDEARGKLGTVIRTLINADQQAQDGRAQLAVLDMIRRAASHAQDALDALGPGGES